ncbi:UDP-glucose 6-dehydrogenase [Actinosynnema sp. ALI-1.44]|nr:UDP-glucose 6-dehydrogenase [Actinosynnema sp. ALI-1.44]
MRFLPGTDSMRVAVIGFGYVGTCLGVTLARRGMPVVAVDSDRAVIDQVRRGTRDIPEPGLAEALADLAGTTLLTCTSDYAAVRDADVVLITVGTPVDEYGALVTGQLEEACRRLAPHLRPGHLVILKSTVSPGTTRTFVAPLLDDSGLTHEVDYGLAFCPERLAEGEAMAQLAELPVVVGGCGPDSSAAAAGFWTRALGVPVRHVPTADTAELVKLATNWWIDGNVAIANELAQLCAGYDVDVLDILAAANELPKGQRHVNILLPSVGVGGSCLTKDPWMAWRAAKDSGLDMRTIETARRVNDEMPAYTGQLIRDELVKLGKDPASAKVAVLGVAFKNDTGDIRGTPVRGVVDSLRGAGTEVALFDPLADPAKVATEFRLAPRASLADAVDGADAVAILAGHRQFHDIDFAWLRTRARMPCLVFDGRVYYPAPVVRSLRELGFHYRGIGR